MLRSLALNSRCCDALPPRASAMLRRLTVPGLSAARAMSTPTHQPTILAVSTMDTKAEELKYVAEQIVAAGCRVELVDVSCSQGASTHPAATITT